MNEGIIERDKAMKRVMENERLEWRESALEIIKTFPKNKVLIGEDFRNRIEREIGKPHHHNVYGPLIKEAVNRGILAHTGQLKTPLTKASHGRKMYSYTLV